mmetsp:Transcript_17376/g.61760  ORF Transcript_17376/g.61760 Transcript_17376/m.61760 type:complete len:216 (-) Transcript_17376:401-1048(-)
MLRRVLENVLGRERRRPSRLVGIVVRGVFAAPPPPLGERHRKRGRLGLGVRLSARRGMIGSHLSGRVGRRADGHLPECGINRVDLCRGDDGRRLFTVGDVRRRRVARAPALRRRERAIRVVGRRPPRDDVVHRELRAERIDLAAELGVDGAVVPRGFRAVVGVGARVHGRALDASHARGEAQGGQRLVELMRVGPEAGQERRAAVAAEGVAEDVR